MKIALLTGGPSLLEFWCEDFARDYDRVIAVNSAGYLFTNDYFAFVDRCVWDELQSGRAKWPRIGFFTHQNWPIPKGIQRLPLPLYDRTLGRVPKALADAQAVTECGYTFPSALLAAQDMAAGGPLDIYGFDYTKELDVAGIDDPVQHGASRWMRELPWVKHCWGKNITVFGKAHPSILAWLRGDMSETEAFGVLVK